MFEGGVINTIKEIIEKGGDTTLKLMIWTLYNLTTCLVIQSRMVQSGAVGLLHDLQAQPSCPDDAKMLACRGAVNLACGTVNSSSLVSQGGFHMIRWLSENCSELSVLGQISIAARNLLNAGSNQMRLADAGVVPALIDVARKAPPEDHYDIRRNVAAGLRTLTFTSATRAYLNEDAISVILGESGGEDLNISPGLLSRLETES